MSHGPGGLGSAPSAPLPAGAADDRRDLQATINVAGSANANATMITKLILFFMFILVYQTNDE
jgi:hypothetical protein